MPLLHTDDGPRRLRALWLGPKGYTLPFEWSYVQWAVTLLMMTICGFVVMGVVRLITADLTYVVVGGVLYGWSAGIYLTVRMMRGVSFDEPLAYKRRLAISQLSGKHRVPVPSGGEWELQTPRISHLSEATLQCMRWSEPEQRPYGHPNFRHLETKASAP